VNTGEKMLKFLITKFKKDSYKNCFSLLFFVLYFLYLLIKINPELYYQYQIPVFFTNLNFLKYYLAYPGGLTEYIGLFLSQFYYYPVVGALIPTAIAILLTKSFGKILEIPKKGLLVVQFVPVALLLLLHNFYKHPLQIDISLLFPVLFFQLYKKIYPSRIVLRIIIFFLLSLILYYITAALFYLFILLCIVYDVLFKRSYIINAFYLIFGYIIPYLACKYVFIVNHKDAYYYLLKYEKVYNWEYLPIATFLSIPVIFISINIINRFYNKKQKKQVTRTSNLIDNLKYVLPMVVLYTATGYLLLYSFDERLKSIQEIEYFARNYEWDMIRKTVSPELMNDKRIMFQLNRALYHLGRLPYEMFIYTQFARAEGLFISDEVGIILPLQKSELNYELGHLNEAQHWACEALAISGFNPWNIQMLAKISLLKGEYKLTYKCLKILGNTILYKDWAEHYKEYLKNKSSLVNDKELFDLKNSFPKSDFIVNTKSPVPDLITLLKENKHNKMAFEYLMGYYLLNKQLDKFVENFEKIADFNYPSIPRHYEEALLIYISKTEGKDINLGGYNLNNQTIKEFNDITLLIQSYGNDRKAAFNSVIAKYGKTYWAYFLYY
jgi:hypothetical protein